MPKLDSFQEASLNSVPIRNLGISIQKTKLEPIIEEFRKELRRAGIRRLKPHFYLSTEWGVPFGSVSLAIPFYLARPDLTELHAEKVGYIEGVGKADILRYLRHETGHVVNYGYKLYEDEEWVKQFGSITQPYVEEYRPEPFSRRFVRHLPGFYAQKHPDEDWAETFAVWLTPGLDWRQEYTGWATALKKLEYCDATVRRLSDQEPLVTATEADEDVGQLPYTLEQYYRSVQDGATEFPRGLDGALRAIFEDVGDPEGEPQAERKPAAALIRRLERELMANVFIWTGHFPERTRTLLRHLARRTEELGQLYPHSRESQAIIGLTTLVSALAMNHVHKGTYLP